MPVYLDILFQIGLPVLAMVGVERFLVYRCLRTPAQVAWARRQVFLHPNVISRARYPMGLVSVALLHFGLGRTAFLFFAFWMITDLTDGDIARRCDLSTEEGATIDPLSDKLLYTPVLLYFAWKGFYDGRLVALFVLFDFFGQFSRKFIRHKAANLFGKSKTFLVTLLLTATAIEWIYGPLAVGHAIPRLFLFCTALAFCSAAFKVIPNYWYANILSLMNLVCGLVGIYVILSGGAPIYALALVFLGQFLDLFDGRAAERWGSTPKGEIFDDVADGTSFGVTVGLIVTTSVAHRGLGLVLGAAHLGATVYRLIRFVVEKRRDGVKGGVALFSGMPSPGGALIAGTACVLLDSDPWKAVMVVSSATLMVSRVPYTHFGRAVLPKIPRVLRVVVLALCLVFLAYGVRRVDYRPLLTIVFLASLVYMASPLTLLFRRKTRRKTRRKGPDRQGR